MEIVTTSPINANEVYRLLDSSNGGSVVFHYAVVRSTTDSKAMSSIEYRAVKDSEDIEKELKEIADEIRTKWEVSDVLIIRALGKMKAADIISLVAVTSEHHEAAFDGSRHGVERLKKMKTVVKHEIFKH